MRKLLFVLSLCFSVAGQQTTPPATGHFTVRGRVVSALTGEPVRGALVTLQGPEQHNGFSGGDGTFEIDSVPAGTFIIQAQHLGYINQIQAGRPQTISLSDNVDGLVVKMPPSARISGTVRDTDGEAVEGLAISMTQQVIMNGRKSWQRAGGGTTTDEGGQFVMDNLRPGSYLLQTSQKAVYPGAPPTGEAARLTYAAQYYPNSPDLASAQIVEVNPGDDSHVDFTVSTVRGVRVSFSVDPPTQFVWGSLQSAAGQQIRTGFPRNNKTGKFSVPSVPPGTWTLTVNAQQQGNQGPATSGETVINVGSTDLDNVLVTLGPALEIPVTISGGDTPPPAANPATNSRKPGIQQFSALGPTQVRLVSPSDVPAAPRINMGGMNSMPNKQGGLSIPNVTPGTYRVSVQTFSTGACLDTVTSGSLDLSRNDLVISPGTAPQPINITLQNNCAELDLTANATGSASFIVIPGSHAAEPTFFTKTALQTAGAVTLKNLSPGDYTVYAFTDITGLEYANPEAMKTFSGQRVTLTAGQTTNLTLDVNNR